MKCQRKPILASIAAYLAVIPIVTVSASAAATLDAQTVRKELTALYAQYGRLLKEDHRYPLKQFFLKHTTEDFILKQDGQQLTREETAERLEEGPMALARFTGHDLKITSLAVKGNEAVVVFKDRVTAVVADPQERQHKLVSTSTTRETWVKSPEGWMTRLSEVLASKTYLNGKEVKPRREPAR
jgi:hypothetical protein